MNETMYMEDPALNEMDLGLETERQANAGAQAAAEVAPTVKAVGKRSLQADRETLLKPLQAVAGAAEKKQLTPILSNVLIEVGPEGARMTATDLELQMTARSQDITTSQPMAFTVAAKKLHDILRTLPEGSKVTMELDAARLTLRAGKGRFNLQTLPAEDFPRLKYAGDATCKITLAEKQLKDMLRRVQFAMAAHDMRHYLNGVLIEVEGDMLRLVATDGHRLSLDGCAIEAGQIVRNGDPAEKVRVVLPRKAALEFEKLLSDTDAPVTLEVGKSQAAMRFGGIGIVSKLIDGQYPDYQRVVPTHYTRHMLADRTLLVAALQRASTLANEKFRGVRLQLADGLLKVACNNTDQEVAEDEIEVSYSSEPLDMGFNINYMLDILTNIPSDEVTFSFGDANSSCLVTTADAANTRHVIMPMRM